MIQNLMNTRTFTILLGSIKVEELSFGVGRGAVTTATDFHGRHLSALPPQGVNHLFMVGMELKSTPCRRGRCTYEEEEKNLHFQPTASTFPEQLIVFPSCVDKVAIPTRKRH
ncbi:hypothetical protein CEXT_596901 [Caerostris extrusa]|uniref:Uncharacterized protein n=1 Tax=Caerostris extrusa TaxID=172846 RepID=A0AAV4TBC4_CAEEX|nr:hypothetical protein CEXT_596901 [Caerostris extrusa]